MPAGIQSFNNSGYVQIDETYRNYHLIRSGQFAASDAATAADQWWNFFYNDTWRHCSPFALMAIICESYPGINCSIGAYRSGVKVPMFHYYRPQGTTVFQFYVFDIVPPSPTNSGLQVFSGGSELIYDANALQMRVLATPLIAVNMPAGPLVLQYSDPAGRKLAWCCTSGGYMIDDDGNDAEVYATYTVTQGNNIYCWMNYSVASSGGILQAGRPEQQGVVVDVSRLPTTYARYS